MAWLKIDDRVRTHPKIAKAGPSAAWLWFCGICYCREHLSDGFIPHEVVSALALNLPSPSKHAAKLVDVRLWELADGGYQVHDFLDWNPSKAEVLSLRDRDRDKKRTYRGTDEGQTRDASRDHAGARGSGSVLGLSRSEVLSEESARETQRPIGWNEAYHRRNCPPWAIRSACRGGFCIPKYLWPKWELRFGGPSAAVSVELREFTDGVMAKTPPGAGDREEEFWPRHFEAKYGTTAPVAQKAGKGARTAHAFDLAAEMLEAQDAARGRS